MVEKKNIALLTSGGDAPGMNAAIRSIVRTLISMGHVPIGVMRGYYGLLNKDFVEMDSRSVSNIVQRGGTILKTSRCPEMKTDRGMQQAVDALNDENIHGLLVIGGDGSYRGAEILGKKWGRPIIGLPGTIDNDIFGTDYTIGYDTAINTALHATDNVRDTAESHERFFVVEVMGRASGHIAMMVGMASGAEYILVPEKSYDIKEIADQLKVFYDRGKKSIIFIVAEGAVKKNVYELTESIKNHSGIEGRVVVLGHIQRGGMPTAFDRTLAARLGYAAVEGIIQGRENVCVGITNQEISFTPMPETWEKKKPLPRYFHDMLPTLRI